MLENIFLQILDYINYPILFILFFLEGPIINFIASAVSATTERFDIMVIFLLAVLGDTLGDLMYFFIGKKAKLRKLKKKIKFIRESKLLKKIEKKLKNNIFLFLLTVKIFSITAVPGIIYLGHKKTDIKKFALYTVILAITFNGLISLVAYNLMITLKTFVKYQNILNILIITVVLGITLLVLIRYLVERIIKKDILDKK